MKYVFLLSGDYIGLGKEEILSLIKIKSHKLIDRLLIIDLNENLNKKLIKRLSLTKNIYNFLFECKAGKLLDSMEEFDWNSVYKDNFCLRAFHFDDNDKKTDKQNPIQKKSINGKFNKNIKKKFTEKNLAGYIWGAVSNPKVNLENPKTEISLFFLKDKVYCGLLFKKIGYDFDSRKSHLRPFPHPSSLHPKVARALINISGIKENEVLLDPFCGTGGFLIEAGLMNIKSVGYDMDKMMINGCIENLRHYKIKNYKIKNKNAINIGDKFDYAVTDLPYGLNSNVYVGNSDNNWKENRINKKIQAKYFKKNLENFYLKFLKSLRKKLKKKAVIVFPSYVNDRKLLKKSKFKIEKEFSIYVHRSLTRKIVKMG